MQKKIFNKENQVIFALILHILFPIVFDKRSPLPVPPMLNYLFIFSLGPEGRAKGKQHLCIATGFVADDIVSPIDI